MNDYIKRLNTYLNSLPKDDEIRCRAMLPCSYGVGLSEQCEDAQGHDGLHFLTEKRVYHKDAIGDFDMEFK